MCDWAWHIAEPKRIESNIFLDPQYLGFARGLSQESWVWYLAKPSLYEFW
jgi:hypothetical protein